MQKVQKHVLISGRVQGVGFRAFVLRNARRLNIKGWVKNLFDGRVEAVFAGEKNQVDKMIEKVHQGPGWARVEDVIIKDEPYNNNLEGFHISY